MSCFHIRWSDSRLDWECHPTKAEAEFAAQQLLRVGESFTIEKCQAGPESRLCPWSQARQANRPGQSAPQQPRVQSKGQNGGARYRVDRHKHSA
jgi:hypothetical protein